MEHVPDTKGTVQRPDVFCVMLAHVMSKAARNKATVDAGRPTTNPQKPPIARAEQRSVEALQPEHVDTDLFELGSRKTHQPQRIGVSHEGMVATAHYHATEAGAEMLADGGNAVDAAVAAAFALGVCEPAGSGLGGQTMILLHLAGEGRTLALDGSSRAPNRVSLETLSKSQRRRGYRSTTVPSTPAVLGYVLKTSGRLPLARVLEPAIRRARDGYRVSVLQHALLRREQKHLVGGPAAQFFLKNGTTAYSAGSTFRQPVLAATLERLAEKGIEDFYTGQIAQLIHEDMERNGGLIRRDDLAQIPYPIERRPLTARFQGKRIFTMPPPGAGRTLAEMLNVYEHLPPELHDLDTPAGAVALAETIRRAFRDRRDRPFDPHFYAQLPEKRMLSVEHAKKVAQRVARRAAVRGETTHLSTMDRDGNAVALTQSIELTYGAAVATPELGFLYNNYMGAFETEDMSHPYYLRPNAAPWASVAPTIVFRGRRPWLVIGSPGSERITPSILQVLLRLATHTPFGAVEAPRLFCALDGLVSLEASRMRDDIPAALQRAGFEVRRRDPYSFYLGCVQMVLRERSEMIGVADPRRDGAALGPGP
jgi:gamma-glutamyltranspeptidase/glutathione hydrolase